MSQLTDNQNAADLLPLEDTPKPKLDPNYLAILEWHLPDTFPDFMVPAEVGEFTVEFKGKILFFAWSMATEKGWYPLLRRLPQYGADCFGFGLTVNGLSVPLMCTVGDPEDPASSPDVAHRA